MRRVVKRALVGLGIMIAVVLLTAGAASTDADWLGGLPWPRHLEWTEYSLTEGYVLTSPTLVDSTGTHETMALPQGTRLIVPRWVPGADPDEVMKRKWREAAENRAASRRDSSAKADTM